MVTCVSAVTVTGECAAEQVVNIVTLGNGTGYGGFYLQPFTGPINGSAGSLASPAHLPPALPESATAPVRAAPAVAAPTVAAAEVPASGPGPAAPGAAPSSAASSSSLSLWSLLLRYVNGAHAHAARRARSSFPRKEAAMPPAVRCAGRRGCVPSRPGRM